MRGIIGISIVLGIAVVSSLYSTTGVQAANKYVTGGCNFRKVNTNSVIFSASQTICTTADHDGCTAAKVACVEAYANQCSQQGGKIVQSGQPCTYGDKC